MARSYDFCGWATRNDIRCSDGRTIRKDAFRDCDGKTVPLVWNHQHNDPINVLGHALLENRKEGVYTYCSFNETELGKSAKEMVRHGDITALSIYANQLKQNGGDVIHGAIREVSLVLAGANPGAFIENVLSHGGDAEDSAYIYTDEVIDLYHSDEQSEAEKTTEEVSEVAHAEDTTKNKTEKEDADMAENKEKTVKEVFDSMTDEQKKVVYALVGMAAEEAANDDSEEGENKMKHNAFDNEGNTDEILSHSEMEAIFADGRRYGSLKDAALAHGIENIEYLFPDAKTLVNEPDMITRDMDWVEKVLNGAHHSPFSRIKSIHADITADDARALGYLPDHTHRDSKGNLVDANGNPAYKKEEVFTLLKRTTTPTTIYKKQKIDRDDLVDITDFNVVNFIKKEMRVMLNEEIARAVLVGDGRLSSSDDKINPLNIRPIYSDDSLYAYHATVPHITGGDAAAVAKAFIKTAIKSRKNYKGSGNPTMFMTEDLLTECLLLEDVNGRVIYDTEEKLRTALRVKEIVSVPVMEGLERETSDGATLELCGIYVNMKDYNIGADEGGSINLFDDFDIDYNAQKYLMETRCSGALVKPYSAVVIEYEAVAATE